MAGQERHERRRLLVQAEMILGAVGSVVGRWIFRVLAVSTEEQTFLALRRSWTRDE